MPPHDFLKTQTLRLATVRVGDLLNTPLESRFNRLAHLARCALGVQAATISLFDGEREWIKTADGANSWEELPLTQSLAASLSRDGVPVLVRDTLEDDRCRLHHLVTRTPGVRFFAVYPLRDQANNVIGALVAYDTAPRQSTDEMTRVLGDVGQLAQRELFLTEAGGAQERLLMKLSSARRQALLDDLTRLWNRRGGRQLLDHAIVNGAGQHEGLGVCIADLDRFKDVNDTHGHRAGDIVLKRSAATMVDSVRPGDAVCRLGGEEFLLIIPAVSVTELTDVLERVRARVAAQTVRIGEVTVRVTLSLGAYLHAPNEPTTTEDLLQRADNAVYQAKAAGRNVVVIS
jgi:diguanylate cyclase (GGDEF)-like protein